MISVLYWIITVQFAIGPVCYADELGLVNSQSAKVLTYTVFWPISFVAENNKTVGMFVEKVGNVYRYRGGMSFAWAGFRMPRLLHKPNFKLVKPGTRR